MTFCCRCKSFFKLANCSVDEGSIVKQKKPLTGQSDDPSELQTSRKKCCCLAPGVLPDQFPAGKLWEWLSLKYPPTNRTCLENHANFKMNFSSVTIWGFPKKWGIPRMDGLSWKIPLKWMIWGYPHLWKPPYIQYRFFQAMFDDWVISWVRRAGCHQAARIPASSAFLRAVSKSFSKAFWSWVSTRIHQDLVDEG